MKGEQTKGNLSGCGQQIIHPKLEELKSYKVPTLNHDLEIHNQVHDIIRYLDNHFETGLCPTDTELNPYSGSIGTVDEFVFQILPEAFYPILFFDKNDTIMQQKLQN
jgi:hypothetical protein